MVNIGGALHDEVVMPWNGPHELFGLRERKGKLLDSDGYDELNGRKFDSVGKRK